MTHMQIKLGNSFSLSFQNMVLGSLCTTWLCSDYLLLQFLAISVYALSSHPSPPAFWPHLPVTAQNSTTLQDTVVHHHIKHLSSHTSSLSLELPNRTHEIWTNYENFTKMQERPPRMQERCVTLSVRETRLLSLSPASCYTAFCSSNFSSLNLSPHLPVVNLV